MVILRVSFERNNTLGPFFISDEEATSISKHGPTVFPNLPGMAGIEDYTGKIWLLNWNKIDYIELEAIDPVDPDDEN